MSDQLRIGFSTFEKHDTFELVDFNGDFVALLRVADILCRKYAVIELVEASNLFPAKLQQDVESGYTLFIDANDVSGLDILSDNTSLTFGPFFLPVSTDQELRDVVRKRAEELSANFYSAVQLGRQLTREFGDEVNGWVSAVAEGAVEGQKRVRQNPRKKIYAPKKMYRPDKRSDPRRFKPQTQYYGGRSKLQSYIIKVYDINGEFPVGYMGEDLETGHAIIVWRKDQASQFGTRTGAEEMADPHGVIGTYQHFLYERFDTAAIADDIRTEVLKVPTEIVRKNPVQDSPDFKKGDVIEVYSQKGNFSTFLELRKTETTTGKDGASYAIWRFDFHKDSELLEVNSVLFDGDFAWLFTSNDNFGPYSYKKTRKRAAKRSVKRPASQVQRKGRTKNKGGFSEGTNINVSGPKGYIGTFKLKEYAKWVFDGNADDHAWFAEMYSTGNGMPTSLIKNAGGTELGLALWLRFNTKGKVWLSGTNGKKVGPFKYKVDRSF